MQLRPDQAATYVRTHHGVLGAGWKEVDAFEDLVEDEDEYEDEEVEEYVTLDLGNGMDGRYLQTESTLQLIGLDTALPHLKVGNVVLQGEVTPLIGTEILLGLIRNQENPHDPSHPPLYTTSKRITFRPITLSLKSDQNTTEPTTASAKEKEKATAVGAGGEDEAGRSMFLMRPAKNGPNRPEVFPGRQRDVIRAEKKKEAREASGGGSSPTKPDDMEVDGQADEDDGAQTPEAGPSTAHALPPLDMTLDDQATMFATGPRSSGRNARGGRPRTRPLLEIHTEAQLKAVNIGILPDNVRILVLPAALSPEAADSFSDSPTSLEFNKSQFKRFISGVPASGPGSRPRSKLAGGEKGARASIVRPRASASGGRQVLSLGGTEPLLLTVPPASAVAGASTAPQGGEMQVDPALMEMEPEEDEPLRELGQEDEPPHPPGS